MSQTRSKSLETTATQLYKAQGRSNALYWDIAQWAAMQAASKVKQAVMIKQLTNALKAAAPDGVPVIRVSQSHLSQMINAYKRWEDVPAAREYHPATLYKYLGKDKELSEYETIAAAKAQGNSRRAMNNGGKPTEDAPESGEAGEAGESVTAGRDDWQAALKDLHALAKSLEMSPAALLRQMIEVTELRRKDVTPE